MLKAFQKRNKLKKIVFGSILVFIAFGMVIYLIPGFTGMTDDPTTTAVVAEVDGEQIRAWDLQQSVLEVSRRNRIPAEMMGLYTTQILDDMLLEKASIKEAARLGIRVSEAELVERLRLIPDLFPGGKFVGQQQYEDLVFSRFSMGVAPFEERFRQSIIVEKLRNLVTDSLTVSPEEVRQEFGQVNEKLVVNYIFVDPADFKKEIAPTDAALQAYYEKNKSRYQIPEKRSAKIVWFEPGRTAATLSIPDGEIRKYYEDRKDTYRSEERVQVSHILLKASANEAAKLAESKKKAEDLLKKLKAGGDFAKLATENSEDPGTASKGGDLGWIVRKQTVPEFEQAAFSLPPGSLSDLVQTTYGIHILKVIAHEQARLKPLEETQAEIQMRLGQQRAQAIIPRQAEEMAAVLRRAPGDVEALAQKVHALAFTPAPLAREDPVPGVGQSPEFQQELFGLQKGQAGRAIPVSSGYAIPILLDVLPTHQGEFAEVKERVKTEFIEEQAREKASAKATELSKLLEQQTKKDLKQAAQSLKLALKTSDPVTRETPIPSLGKLTDLDPNVFTKAVGEIAGPLPATTGQVAFQIASRQPSKEEDFAIQKQQIEDRLLAQKRQQAFSVFQDSLRSKLEASGDLKIYQDVLSRTAAGNQPLPHPHPHPPGF